MSRSTSELIRILGSVDYLDSRLIRPSPAQIREDLGNLEELVDSIKKNGLLQPVIVRPVREYFEVVAGNRRLAACRQLRISRVLCVIKELTDKEAYEISLIENVQRKTLDVLEEAKAFKNYLDDFGYGSVTELAGRIGKSEEYVSHRVLLLTLPREVLDKVSSRLLSPSAAEELIWIKDPQKQALLADELIRRKLSTKRARTLIKLVRQDAGIIHGADGNDDVMEMTPDFQRSGVLSEKKNDSVKIIAEATLIFKSTLIRLDSLISRTGDNTALREALVAKRYAVHQLLDELVCIRNNKTQDYWGTHPVKN